MPAVKKFDVGGSRAVNVGDVEVLKKTDQAILVKAIGDDDLNGDCKKTWVAFSQIATRESDINAESDEGDTGRLFVPLWLAESNGWV